MFEVLVQVPIGFFVALSGALVPGPLLAYAIAKTTEEGRQIGPMIVLGHLAVEAVVIGLLILGIGGVLARPALERALGLTGGSLLIIVALWSLARSGNAEGKVPVTSFHPIVGGFLFSSIFNPTVPLWWVGIGFALMVEAYAVGSYAGVAAWLIGHYAADFGWFSLVSYLVGRNRAGLERARRALLALCVAILLSLGVYLILKYILTF
jgi:threonine/homoserine/homoserine lactone efflux protein